MGSLRMTGKAPCAALPESSCAYLHQELKMIWDEVGQEENERERILEELEQECQEVYRRKVNSANMSRIQLHQALAESEAEFTNLLLSLGERSFPGRPEKMTGTLKEQLNSITPALQEMQMRKEARLKQFIEVQTEVQRIASEIAGRLENEVVTVNEEDLSLKKLEDHQSELQRLKREKSDRLCKVEEYKLLIHNFAKIMGMDPLKILADVHSSLLDGGNQQQTKNISDDILNKLNTMVQQLKGEKKHRMEKLHSLGKALTNLWNILDTTMEERQPYGEIKIFSVTTGNSMLGPGSLTLETIQQEASLSSPAFPHSALLLAPLASVLSALLSVCGGPLLGHLHTVSLLSSSAASLSQFAADARLLVSPASGEGEGDGADSLLPRLRLGSSVSRAAALDSLAGSVGSLPASSASSAVSAVAAMLDSGDLLPASRDKAVSVLAAFASSDAACRFLVQESGTVLPHLCRALESGGAGAEHACVALHPLTAASRDASAAIASRGGVAALLAACAAGTPAAQAAAVSVLRNLAAFPDILPAFREEGALPLLLQLVSLGTPRAQEHALGCLQNLTASDSDEGQRLKVEAFQAGALGCVKDFLESSRGDEPGLAPAFGLLRNMASFRYIAEIVVSASFVSHVVTALASDKANTRTEAAMALAELCNVGSGKARKMVGDAVPRLIWMLEAKAVTERDAAARALAALVAASGYRKLFKKDERSIVNAVQLLDPSTQGVDKRYPVLVLLAVSQSRRCRKRMVAAGACGYLQGLMAAEVDGAKKLAECLRRGKMLGVFPRS